MAQWHAWCGITAEMRRLTVGTRDGGTRHLALRTFVDPYFVEHAEDMLHREADAVVPPCGADAVAWAAATDVIRVTACSSVRMPRSRT